MTTNVVHTVTPPTPAPRPEPPRTLLPGLGMTVHPDRGDQLDIAQALQTTLEPDELLRLFSGEAKRFVRHAGLTFSNARRMIDLQIGTVGRHRCDWGLVVDRMGGKPGEKEELGRLAFTRRSRFSDTEIQTLEALLCLLIHPLRNALLYSEARRSAHTDPLTGACNRGAFDMALHREVSLARRQGTPLSLAVIDLDHFKKINDRYGHSTGDEVLRAVAEIIRNNKRDSDVLFRYGGEEFVLLLANTNLAGAKLVADRIRRAVAEFSSDTLPTVTISTGIAALAPGEEQASLFNRADAALYEAKREGRNRVAFARATPDAPVAA